MFDTKERKLTVMLMAALCFSGGTVALAAPPPPPVNPRDDAGLEMRRQREEAERERLRQQMEEDRKKQDEKVQGNTETPASTGEAEVKFVLNKVTIDESAIIKTDSFNEITEPYLGKEVSLADLSNIVEKINAIYAAEGYATCKAYLPQQTIENGHVHIALIEGKTGEVSISGNKHTKESYIRNRLPLRSGTVQNFNELNKKLFRFNATNDARLGITVKAGKVPGTTDYEIVLQEPKNDVFTLSVDNSGGSNNGEWREGFYYTNRSLSGRRDSLTASYTRAKGLNSVGLNYATPVGRQGAKLFFDYSTSTNELIEGSMRNLKSNGHGWYLGAAYLQPLILNQTTRTEAKIGVYRQNSQTDMQDGAVPWLDSWANNLYLSFAMTSYGKSSAFYHQHYFGIGHANAYQANTGTYAKKDYSLYRLNSLYQKSWQNGHMLTGRLNLQWSGVHDLPSAEQFFLGGLNSVRGYKRDLVSGDNGMTFSAEYAIPLNRKRTASVYGFFDYGTIMGDTAYDDHVLTSVGLGLRGNIKQAIYMDLSIGFPLEKDLNGSQVSKTRIHFGMNAQF